MHTPLEFPLECIGKRDLADFLSQSSQSRTCSQTYSWERDQCQGPGPYPSFRAKEPSSDCIFQDEIGPRPSYLFECFVQDVHCYPDGVWLCSITHWLVEEAIRAAGVESKRYMVQLEPCGAADFLI